MLELSAKKDIEKISLDILKSSKALDVFPTPIDKIVGFSDLIIAKDIDIASLESSFFNNISSALLNKLKKIRGILDRKEKLIYLDLNQSEHRKNFVKLHEVGHNILPWQKDTMQYLDDDNTLNPETFEEFEAEANYFASATLFQHDRFVYELEKLPLSIESAMYLAKHFDSSVHAALRRYVETSKKSCALLVLENISPKGSKPSCSVRNYFSSKRFTKLFGDIQWQPQLGFTWPFVKDYYYRKKFKKDGEIVLETLNGQVKFTYHFFDNTYNAFVLIFPVGKVHKSRVTFVINGA